MAHNKNIATNSQNPRADESLPACQGEKAGRARIRSGELPVIGNYRFKFRTKDSPVNTFSFNLSSV